MTNKYINFKFDDKCFLNQNIKKIIPFIPETETKLLKYNKKIWNNKFRYVQNLDYKKLQLTNIGIYSIASKEVCELIPNIIKKNFKQKYWKKLVITDITGGIGGFSCVILDDFKFVNIIEINPIHAKIIKNNLNVYGLDKKLYKIYNNDYMLMMNKLNQHILIADLPWGGYNYKNNKAINLGLNNINIGCLIKYLLNNDKFILFILFVPKNYNYNFLINQINITTDIMIKYIFNSKHKCIIIKNNKSKI